MQTQNPSGRHIETYKPDTGLAKSHKYLPSSTTEVVAFPASLHQLDLRQHKQILELPCASKSIYLSLKQRVMISQVNSGDHETAN